ncbi:MAG TPA: M6 family metalloprotease domain-containing protein [Acholeplasma sp.]|nr:M6 family metalloprotease domain-containing protein [Acholeplasma sp.]
MKQIRILFSLVFLALTVLFLTNCATTTKTLNDQLDSISNYQYTYQVDETLYDISTDGLSYQVTETSGDEILNVIVINTGLYISYNDEAFQFIEASNPYYGVFTNDIYLLDISAIKDLAFIVSLDNYKLEESNTLIKSHLINDITVKLTDEIIESFTFILDQTAVSLMFKSLDTFNLTLPTEALAFSPKSFDDNQTVGNLVSISTAFIVSLTDMHLILNTKNNHSVVINNFDYSHMSNFSERDEVVFAHKIVDDKVTVLNVLNYKSEMTYTFPSIALETLSATVSEVHFNNFFSLKNITLTSKSSNTATFTHGANTFDILFSNEQLLFLGDLTLENNYDFSSLILLDSKTLFFGNLAQFSIVSQNDAPFTPTNLDNVKTKSTDYNLSTGLPSIGNPKVLVLPISFSNYTAPYDMVINLETALFGDKSQTGYHSLTSYYNQSSYGKLNIDGEVLQPYQSNKTSTYYENSYENGNDAVDYELLKLALDYHNSSTDYSKFDSDNDGYIDAIIMVYTAPVAFEGGSDLWWAYTYQYESTPVKYYDSVLPDYYVFMGYDFLSEKVNESQDLDLNALTFIHETGHLLGLDDYYDYELDTGPAGGIGGSDMMDSTVGDHNPFSKLLLGWVTPLVVTPYDVTLSLKPFQTSGEAILIPKSYNGTIFDEYLLIDFYTPTHLNALQNGFGGLFTIPGIRIYHVNAGLNKTSEIYNMWSLPKNNNSDSMNKLLKLIEADGYNDIENTNNSKYGEYSEDSDLFGANDMLKNYRWYDGTSVNFTLLVDQINETSATITIDYK